MSVSHFQLLFESQERFPPQLKRESLGLHELLHLWRFLAQPLRMLRRAVKE